MHPTHTVVKSHYAVATKGSNVTVKCEVLNTIWTKAIWVWLFNGTAVYDQNPRHHSQSVVKFDDRFTMILSIRNVSERDVGLYECVVYTVPGEDRNNITLIVDEKGNILKCQRR